MSMYKYLREALWRFANRGTLTSDSDKQRLRKAVVTLVATAIASMAVLWGGLYTLVGYPWSAAIPLVYSLLTFASLAYFLRTRRFRFFLVSQLVMIFVLPFLLQWSLGGFANGSAVMIWSFFVPLVAMLFAQPQHANKWLVAYLIVMSLGAVLELYPLHSPATMPPNLNLLFFVLNIGSGSVLIFLLVSAVNSDREKTLMEIQRTKTLLEQANIKLKEKQDEIHGLMMTDTLTGIPNRRYLDERLSHELERLRRKAGSLSVVMADIDHFKQINDEHGHAVGDQVLTGFARLLQQKLRNCDFVSRYGGEEFVMLLPDTDPRGASGFVDRIHADLRCQPIPPLTEPITSSFGITGAKPGESTANLLKRVDEALYRSKREGRDRTTIA